MFLGVVGGLYATIKSVCCSGKSIFRMEEFCSNQGLRMNCGLMVLHQHLVFIFQWKASVTKGYICSQYEPLAAVRRICSRIII